MANENQPGHAPQHMSSQTVPQGNQTSGSNAPLEKQLLELQRREREITKKEAALKSAVSFDSLKDRAKSDRNALLRELGLEDLITEDTSDPVVALRKEMETMKAAAQQKEQAEREARERHDFRSKLAEKKEEFELLMSLGYEDRAYDLLKSHDPESGETPDMYSVAKQLDDAIFNDISKLKDTKRFKELFPSSPSQTRHPMDTNTTITSSDRGQTQQSQTQTPTVNRYQDIADAAKHLKFD